MRVLLALLVTVLGWSSAFIFIRIGLESYTPEFLTLARYLLAALISIFIYANIRNKPNIAFSDRIKAFGSGIIGMGFYSYAMAVGEITVPASIAGFIVGLMPLFASLLAAVIFREPLSKRLLIGIGFSLIGMFIIAFSGHHEASFGKGLLWVILAMCCSTTYTLIQKPIIKRLTATVFTCHALWGASIFLFIPNFFFSSDFIGQIARASPVATFSIFYQAIVPTILAFFCWSYALNKINIAKAGIALYTMPLFTAFLAYFMIKEVPTIIALIGMVLAFLGSLIGSIKIPRKAAVSSVSHQVAVGGIEDKIASGLPPD